jgi:hypothetical protein
VPDVCDRRSVSNQRDSISSENKRSSLAKARVGNTRQLLEDLCNSEAPIEEPESRKKRGAPRVQNLSTETGGSTNDPLNDNKPRERHSSISKPRERHRSISAQRHRRSVDSHEEMSIRHGSMPSLRALDGGAFY